MQLNLPLMPAILVCSGIFLIVMANIVFYSILGEVNSRRPPDQQISMLFVNIRLFEVLRLHKELFPKSGKRAAVWVLAVVGIAMIMSLFAFGRAAQL